MSLVKLLVLNTFKVGESLPFNFNFPAVVFRFVSECAQTTELVVLARCGFTPVQGRAEFDFTGSGWDKLSYGSKSLMVLHTLLPAVC